MNNVYMCVCLCVRLSILSMQTPQAKHVERLKENLVRLNAKQSLSKNYRKLLLYTCTKRMICEYKVNQRLKSITQYLHATMERVSALYNVSEIDKITTYEADENLDRFKTISKWVSMCSPGPLCVRLHKWSNG